MSKDKIEPRFDLEDRPAWAWCGVDCETSSLFDFSRPADAPGQPRLAAVSLIRATPGFAITDQQTFFVKPDGWRMDPGAMAVNGLTDDFLAEHGVPIAEVLDAYEAVLDEGRALIAFNAQFDTKVMRAELRRAGRKDRFDSTPNVCVMRKCIGVCKIPKTNGRGYKFPKLVEAMSHFKLPQPEAHTAAGDALSAVMIARMLSQIGVDLSPEVHYAKSRPADETQASEAGPSSESVPDEANRDAG